MTAFYNEPDPYAAAWLENLIAAGHIAPGIVDRRPIQEIEAGELEGFTQCHFFAGIGIWSHALRRAGWSDDRPIWTGSCPCQPFSAAGQRKGIHDERHLWPYWIKLIEQCHPAIVLGEQVASKDGLGWLDLVSADLEGADYAFGASDLCAAGFGQAHIRQRLYFVGLADDDDARLEGWSSVERSGSGNQCTTRSSSMVGRLGNSFIGTSQRDAGEIFATQTRQHGERCAVNGGFGERSSNAGGVSGLEYSNSAGQYERAPSRKQSLCVVGDGTLQKSNHRDPGEIDERWLALDWLLCRNPAGEPSWRPVKPGTFPLAHGITNRMGKLRAFGNGLDAETATNFCEVVREIADDLQPVKREYDL